VTSVRANNLLESIQRGDSPTARKQSRSSLCANRLRLTRFSLTVCVIHNTVETAKHEDSGETRVVGQRASKRDASKSSEPTIEMTVGQTWARMTGLQFDRLSHIHMPGPPAGTLDVALATTRRKVRPSALSTLDALVRFTSLNVFIPRVIRPSANKRKNATNTYRGQPQLARIVPCILDPWG
jgi:hypothetical protein